jgi:hypothetical protein
MSTEHHRATMDRSGTFTVELSAADTLPFFTPEGERLWIDGWAPAYPGGKSELQEGVVFQTSTEAGQATWCVTGWDPEAGTATYVYVLPEHRLAQVYVSVESTGEDRCQVHIRYRMTSLSPEADAFVLGFEESFAELPVKWAKVLKEHVDAGGPLAVAQRRHWSTTARPLIVSPQLQH